MGCLSFPREKRGGAGRQPPISGKHTPCPPQLLPSGNLNAVAEDKLPVGLFSLDLVCANCYRFKKKKKKTPFRSILIFIILLELLLHFLIPKYSDVRLFFSLFSPITTAFTSPRVSCSFVGFSR